MKNKSDDLKIITDMLTYIGVGFLYTLAVLLGGAFAYIVYKWTTAHWQVASITACFIAGVVALAFTDK